LFARRAIILICVLLAAGIVLTARLAQVQIAWHDALSAKDYTRLRDDRLLCTVRGSISTRDGVLLARDDVAFDLSVHYDHLLEEDWKGQISDLCGVPLGEITESARAISARVERIWRAVRARTGREDLRIVEQNQYHPVIRNLAVDAAAVIRTHPLRFPGIRVAPRSARRYPNGSLAPHIVGQLGPISASEWEELKGRGMTWTNPMPMAEIGKRYTPDDRSGKSGIEKSYERLLRGSRGFVENRLVFRTLRVEKRHYTTPPAPGLDVYLTLLSDFQRAANEALTWAASDPDIKLERGALVIMDVRDGSILAAASYPGFDASSYRKDYASLSEDERSPLLFRPTQAALPIGSVYKLITAAAGLEEGKIVPSTTLECRGFKIFAGRKFHCTARWGHGNLNLREAIEHSCNVYFFQVAARVGGEALAEWGRRFGLGQATGVDLPYERTGQVPTPRSLHGTLNLAIGQGKMLSTPLQVARMVAAIANGGDLVRPHFFDHAQDADGTVVKTFEPESVKVPVSAETLRVIREGMRMVVQSGTARSAGLDAFRAAGKTGTAELTRDMNHAWFAGFAPYDDPKIAFAVVSERTPGHGGSHAAPIMAETLRRIWPQVLELEPEARPR